MEIKRRKHETDPLLARDRSPSNRRPLLDASVDDFASPAENWRWLDDLQFIAVQGDSILYLCSFNVREERAFIMIRQSLISFIDRPGPKISREPYCCRLELV